MTCPGPGYGASDRPATGRDSPALDRARATARMCLTSEARAPTRAIYGRDRTAKA